MLRGRTLTVVLVALGMGGMAAWWAAHWAQARMAPGAKQDGTPVVVAVIQIPFGKKIEASDLVVKRVPVELVPQGAFKSVEELDKKVAVVPIYPGEVIIKEKLAGYQGGSPLSAIVAVNKRAVTVRVNDVIGVAGFLLPGNFVDVVSATGRDGASARTILQNMKVLAVDQTTSTNKDDPVIVRAVTLEMSPEEAELLVKATQSGAVQLTLRNPLDTTVAQGKRASAAVKQPKPTPAPEVMVIRGTKVSSTAVGM